MKKSTSRIVKSLGIFLFLMLFGVFIFVLTRNQSAERKEIAQSGDPSSVDELDNPMEYEPIGFTYQGPIEDLNSDVRAAS
jgi:hypothetical protein